MSSASPSGDVSHGVHTAANPTVHTRPPGPGDVHKPQWTAEIRQAKGHLKVNHHVLHEVAAAIAADMKDLDEAVGRLRAASQRLGSLPLWSTGKQFSENLAAARDGFVTATGQASDAHGMAAKNLVDTASTYEGVEAEIHRNRHHRKASS